MSSIPSPSSGIGWRDIQLCVEGGALTYRAADTPALVARGTAGPHPPLPGQCRWIERYRTSENPRDMHIVSAMLLTGDLDESALHVSLEGLLARHSILRGRFDFDEHNRPQLLIADAGAIRIQRLAVTDTRALQDAILDFAVARFDLNRGPLVRIALARLGPRAHALILVLHRVICDGASRQILWAELIAGYRTCVGRITPCFQPLKLQFTDFCHFQEAWMHSSHAQARKDYWRARLAGATRAFFFPWDGGAASCIDPHSLLEERLDAIVTYRLLAKGRLLQSDLMVLALSALASLMIRWSARSDVAMWVCHPGRRRPEIIPNIGCFHDTWLLRVIAHNCETFEDVLHAVRTAYLEALANIDLPGPVIRDQLRTRTDVTHVGPTAAPAGDHKRDFILVGYQRVARPHSTPATAPAGIQVEPIPIPGSGRYLESGATEAARVTFLEASGTLSWTLQYDPARLADHTATLIVQSLASMLRAFSEPSSTPFALAQCCAELARKGTLTTPVP